MISVHKLPQFSDLHVITVFHQLSILDFSLAATDSGPLYTCVFYYGKNTLNLEDLYDNGHWCSSFLLLPYMALLL